MPSNVSKSLREIPTARPHRRQIMGAASAVTRRTLPDRLPFARRTVSLSRRSGARSASGGLDHRAIALLGGLRRRAQEAADFCHDTPAARAAMTASRTWRSLRARSRAARSSRYSSTGRSSSRRSSARGPSSSARATCDGALDGRFTPRARDDCEGAGVGEALRSLHPRRPREAPHPRRRSM